MQARLIGVLYLENKMVFGAFTPDRIEIVRLLAAEAAISLENAKLFDGLKKEIQERTQAEQKLRTALIEVEQLKNALEEENTYLRRDLIANVSHDLRTPLTSLRGYLETLLTKEHSLPAAERRSYLEIAVRQSQRLANLVEELFALAKLDFKGAELILEPVHLGEIAYDVLQKFKLAAERRRVHLGIEVLDELPLVHADVSLVERVFDNLIGNALNHSPEGGAINVEMTSNGQCVTVNVTDTGHGIPQADIPFIFDRFYRGDKSRATSSAGAGLGLAITKRIVELHGGEISVESKPLAGARFSFSIPVSPMCPK